MISHTLKCQEDGDEIKIDWRLIKNFVKIIFVLLIILTIIFFMGFGCFLVLNDSTGRQPKTVTLSSEGAANETYPDMMGEYEKYRWFSDDNVIMIYRHKDSKKRFLSYNVHGMYYVLNINMIS